MNAPASLATLAATWAQVKAEEDAAKARRLEIEAQIVGVMPAKDEGVTKVEQDGLRVSVTYKLTRSVDTDAVRGAWGSLQPAVQSAFRWKADIDTKALRELDAQEAQQIAPFITTKPAKPSVKVEPIN